MFIAILVLLGLAGAIWYFARKQTQTVTLSQEDVVASDPLIQVAKETNERLEKMSKKIDKALAEAPELPSKKVKAEVAPEPVVDLIPVVETPTPELVKDVEEIITKTVVETPVQVSEVPKPAKKKRRYYPKKK